VSALTISVSVEGLEFVAWEAVFRSKIAAAPAAFGLAADSGAAAGTLGAKRSRSVKVRTSESGESPDTLKLLAVILSSLSLAIGATQLGLNVHKDGSAPTKPATPVFVCRVEGEKGVTELRIEDSAIPSEAVLRKCIDQIGTPKKIRAVVPGRS
jgi:hypothetical protein